MKKRNFYILMFLIINFSFVKVVLAADYNVIVNAEQSAKEVYSGEEVITTLKLKSDMPIDVCHFKISSDSGIEYISMNAKEPYEVTSGTINDFILENKNYDNNGSLNNVTVMDIKYKVNSRGSVVIKTLDCAYVGGNTSEDWYSDETIDTVTLNFNVKNDTTLSDLQVINGGTMTSKFEPNKTGTYYIELNSLKFGLSLTTTDPNYQDKIKIINKNNSKEITDINNIIYETNGKSEMSIAITINEATTYDLVVSYKEHNDNKDNESTIENPKTGKFWILFVIALLNISLIFTAIKNKKIKTK